MSYKVTARRWIIALAVLALAVGAVWWYSATRLQTPREVYAVQAWTSLLQRNPGNNLPPSSLKLIPGDRLLENWFILTPRVYDFHGQLLWEFNQPGEFNNGCRVAGDGSLVIVTNRGNVYAYAPDYRLKWTFAGGSEPNCFNSLAVAEDGAVFAGTCRHNLYALARDGSLRWQLTSAEFNTWPAPLCLPDGGVLIHGEEDCLIALAADGTERWRTKPAMAGSGTWLLPADPAAQEPAVIVSNDHNHPVITGWDLDGNQLWQQQVGGYPDNWFSYVYDGIGYFAVTCEPESLLIAMDRHGNTLWHQPTMPMASQHCIMPDGDTVILMNPPLPGRGFGLLLLALKDKLNRGHLVEMRVVSPQGEVVQRYRLPFQFSHCSPVALPDGTVLVVGDDGVLHCYEVP